MDELSFLVSKAVLYACASYPKVAAPHRLSTSKDFELCILSGLSALEGVSALASSLEAYRRGDKALGEIELGKSMAEALACSLRELGYELSLEVSLSTPILYAISWMNKNMGMTIVDSVNSIQRAMALGGSEDAVLFVKALKALGGEVVLILDRAEVNERRISIEGMNLIDVFRNLSRVSERFEFFTKLTDALTMLNYAKDLVDRGLSVNESLALTFLDMLKHRGIKEVSHITRIGLRELFELLKIDREFRKRGYDFAYLIPYLLVTALGLVLYGY